MDQRTVKISYSGSYTVENLKPLLGNRLQHLGKGAVDTLIIGDSILQHVDEIRHAKVDEIRHAKVYSLPGLKCRELQNMVTLVLLPELAYVDVVVVHVGTCDTTLNESGLYFAISDMIRAIKYKYRNLQVIWSQMLTRLDQTRKVNVKITNVNRTMKMRRFGLGIFILPTPMSFLSGKYVINSL